jgi:hypothetical protein
MVEGGGAMSTELTPFDYTTCGAKATVIQGIASRVRDRIRRAAEWIVEIGIELNDAKNLLPHGSFGDWLQSEFEWSERTAQRYMRIANRFDEKRHTVGFGSSALYALSSPDVPEEAIDEAIEAAKAEPVTVAKAKEIIERHKPEPDEPTELEGPGNACDIDNGVPWNREPPMPPSNVATIWRELQAKLDTFEAQFEKSAQDCDEARDVMADLDKLQDRYGYYVRNVEGG